MATFNYASRSITADLAGESLAAGLYRDPSNQWVAFTSLYGQAGDDVLNGGVPGSAVNPPDYTVTYTGDDYLAGGGGNDTVFGNAGNDTIRGDDGNDALIGGAGNDYLQGGTGNDLLEGGEGNDSLDGDYGNDTLYGGVGDDSLNGYYGANLLSGDDGNDVLESLGTGDTVLGGRGDDVFKPQGGEAIIDGGSGNDTLISISRLYNIVISNVENLLLSSNAWLTGEQLNSFIRVAPISSSNFTRIDVTTGGSFGANFAYAEFVQTPTFGGSEFSDTVALGASSTAWLVQGNAGDDIVMGGLGNDSLSGGDGNDSLSGGLGNDQLNGDFGNDTLDGGPGADTMYGGLGNDTYFVDDLADFVGDAGYLNTDTVWVGVDNYQFAAVTQGTIEYIYLYGAAASVTGGYTSGAESFAGFSGAQIVANPTLAGTLTGRTGNDTLWGSGLAETLNGGAGDDIIRGQGGADVMLGGTGNDQFVVSNAAATVIEAASEGTDTIWVDTTGYVIPDNIEVTRLVASNATLSGNAGANVITTAGANTRLNGMAGNDELWGSTGPDTLDGGAGDDILRGQGGADSFIGGTGNDQFVVFSANATITENADEGYDIAYITASGFTMGLNLEVGRLYDQATSLSGSAMGENLVANQALGSTLLGRGGNDILWGSSRADVFDGGTQDDIIYSYGGADRFLYGQAGWGFDQISGFDRAQGMKIDMTGLGTSFAALQSGFQFGGGNGQVSFGADTILVYGVTSFIASDFIF